MLAKGAATMMWRGRHACSCGEHAVLCVWCVEDSAHRVRSRVLYVRSCPTCSLSTCLLRKRCETCSLLTGKSFYYCFASAAGRSGVYICTACRWFLGFLYRDPPATHVFSVGCAQRG